MDMMPPIWLWARRCSSQKKPMNSAMGSSSGRSASKIEGCGFENSTSTSCSRNSARSSSGGSVGPFDGELGAVGELAGDRAAVVGPGDLVDLVGGHLGPQVGVGDLSLLSPDDTLSRSQQRHERAAEDPDGPSGHLLAAGAPSRSRSRSPGRAAIAPAEGAAEAAGETADS